MSTDAEHATPPEGKAEAGWVKMAVVALLAVYALLALNAALHKGPAFDEGAQLDAGYNIWRQQDFRLMAGNGDFVQRWATLPYLVTKPNPAPDTGPNYRGLGHVLGYQFFFQSGNAPEWLLLQGRLMVLLLGIALGWLVFVCAREVAGPIGALAALVLYIFGNNMLAFGAMVSSEIPMSLAFLGALWCLWRFLDRATWGRLAGCLGFSVLLALSRWSAVAFGPIMLAVAAVRIGAGQPWPWRLGQPRMITSRVAQSAIVAGLYLILALGAWLAIWADYDFHYSANFGATTAAVQGAPSTPGNWAERALTSAKSLHLLPEAYVDGTLGVLEGKDLRQTFLDGKWNAQGWPNYFFASSAEKTSPVQVVIFLIGLGAWALWLAANLHWRLAKSSSANATHAVINYWEAVPYLILIGMFGLLAVFNATGLRTIMPVFPAIYIIGGLGTAWVWQLRAHWVRALVVALYLWRIGETMAVYPDFFAYLNPLVDEPDQGYQHLVDKALDWGMDLPALQDYLAHNNPDHQPVYLAYFGTDDPDYYGFKFRRLPSYPDWTPRDRFGLEPGIYAISATLLQTLYTPTFGPWNKVFEEEYQSSLREMRTFDQTGADRAARQALIAQRPPRYWENLYARYDQLRFARLCSWLRHHRDPEATAGHSILIWKLNANELDAALNAGPPELAEKPL